MNTKNDLPSTFGVDGVKISNMDSVLEYTEGLPVELWINPKSYRLVIRAYNECGNNYTEVDLLSVLEWVKKGPELIVPVLPEAGPSTSSITMNYFIEHEKDNGGNS